MVYGGMGGGPRGDHNIVIQVDDWTSREGYIFKKRKNSFSQNYFFSFWGCESCTQPTDKINAGTGRGTLAKHTPIPMVGTKNQICPKNFKT